MSEPVDDVSAAARTRRRGDPPPRIRGAVAVAVVLAIGISTAMNMFTLAVLWDAIFSEQSGLSSNATLVLTGWGGGIVGVIGAVVGYNVGAADKKPGETTNPV